MRTAAELVARARTARFQQDSALAEYYAIAKQRWSAGLGVAAAAGLGPMGRVRLGARFESVARVGWHHQYGAWAELIAARAVAPIVGEMEPTPDDDGPVLTLPYYPGRDALWPTTELKDAFPEKGGWITHPLDAGSDSLYHFSLGSPLTITLPGGKMIRLRELLLRPVRPDSRLIVGSLWVDIESGALVRAAYRPSVPIDLWPLMKENFDDDEFEIFSKFGPFWGNVEEVVIEHGLYEERFWLPRVRIAHASGTAKIGLVTISIEQTFDYEKVSALPAGSVASARVDPEPPPERSGDMDRYREWQQRARRTLPCREFDDGRERKFSPDSIPRRDDLTIREWEGVRLRVLLPCVRNDLLVSKALPPSIYSPSEELFTETDLTALRNDVSKALSITSQAEWKPQPATIHYGLEGGLLRYNRIEGISAAVRADRQLGKGYELSALARLGTADLEPNAEVSLRRASGHGDRRVAAYRRLDTMNDWGNPLGFGSSLNAFFLGRDEGFYHRTLGAEVRGTYSRVSGGPSLSWRLFAERHDPATVQTTFSFARMIGGSRFLPNIAAQAGNFYGAAAALTFALGSDPTGTQFSGTLRADGAGGELGYGRAFTELRLAHGLGRGVLGAVTSAAGTSVGTVPPQRLWYLGGAHTIHAHPAGAASGDAFWMTRAELTKGLPMIRPILFADLGWAGDRRDWTTTRERYWAAGLGAAALDGLVRFDVSRAIDRSRRWQVDLFIEVR